MADQSIQIGDRANLERAEAIALGVNNVANHKSNNSTYNGGANIVAISFTSSPGGNEPLTRSQNRSFENRSLPPDISPGVDHTEEAIRCFRIMNDQLHQDILDVGVGPEQFLTNAEVISRWSRKRDEKISAELKDACIHWAKHLKKADKNNERVVRKFEKFVNKHLLHWIEALSWINKLDSADQSLKDGIAFLDSESTSTSSNTSKLLSEGQLLISNFRGLIKQTALHIYRTALPLMPNESVLYHKYSREMRNNLYRVLSCRPEDSHGIINRSRHQQSVSRIVFSCQPSTYFASWSGDVVTVWDSTTGTSCASFTDPGTPIALADNFNVGASSRESSVCLYNFLNQTTQTLPASAPVLRIALSSDGCRLAVGSSDGKIRLWDVGEDPVSVIRDIDGFECRNQEYCQLVFSPNESAGARLVFSSGHCGLGFLDASDGKRITNPCYPPAMHFTLVFSNDGSRLASLGKGKDEKHILTVWDVVNGVLLSIWASPGSFGSVLAISVDGSLIATGGDGHPLLLWSWNRGGTLTSDALPCHLSNRISYLAFSPTEHDMLVIGFVDADTALCDVNESSIVRTIPKHNLSAASFSPDRTRLATGYQDGTLDLRDMSSFWASCVMSRTKSAFVSILAFSPDCSRLASGFEDGTIRLWDTECPSQPLAIHQGHSVKVTALVFRLDGALFASWAADGIRIWDSNGSPFTDYHKFPNPGKLTSVAFSGIVLAAATVDGTILWDIRTWEKGLLLGSTFLSFSNPENGQSRLLASFNSDKDVRVWDIKANTRVAQSHFGDIQIPDG
ncbi:WD40-repeat-containing domain protein [Amanita muscaria]